MNRQNRRKGPLEGVRVLDFTRVLAGPYTTMLLSDLGAQVVKIEQPGAGDDTRTFGPYQNGESSYFMFLNRGKQGMTLNLKDSRAVEIVLDLVRISDVVVENFKPGVMKKLGIDYETLKTVNPELVMCSISGFGQSGSLSNRPAYDLVVQAMSGMMSINGYPDNPPSRTGVSLGDMCSAMYAGMAIMTALYHRERTGEGQYLDISMLDGVFAFLESNVVRYTVGETVPQRVGSRHPLSAPFDIYRAKDGYLVIAVANDSLFLRLCVLMNRPELARDKRYCTNDERSANEISLKALIEDWMSEYSVNRAVTLLVEAGVPASPVLNIGETCESEYIAKRGMLFPIYHQVAGEISIPASPLNVSGLAPQPTKASPLLGEHNDMILHDLLGYSQTEIQQLRDNSVI